MHLSYYIAAIDFKGVVLSYQLMGISFRGRTNELSYYLSLPENASIIHYRFCYYLIGSLVETYKAL